MHFCFAGKLSTGQPADNQGFGFAQKQPNIELTVKRYYVL
jgi:hypothetical protein